MAFPTEVASRSLSLFGLFEHQGWGLGQGREIDWGEGRCAQYKLGLSKTKSVCVGVVTQLKDWRKEITWPGPPRTELCGQYVPGGGDSMSKGWQI